MDAKLKEAISYGADFGLKSSCLFSVMYAVTGTAIWIIFSDYLAGFVNGVYLFSIAIALFLLLVMAVPLLVLGAVTGATLSVILRKTNQQLTVRKSFFLGVGIGIVILLLTAIVITSTLGLLSMDAVNKAVNQKKGIDSYLGDDLLLTTPRQDLFLFLVLPVTIYLSASGWAGQRMYKKYHSPVMATFVIQR